MEKPYEVAFFMEQTLGHVTHAKNLFANVSQDETVNVHWAAIPFEVSGRAAKIPLYGNNWAVRSGLLTRHALRQISRQAPLDLLFFHTQTLAVLSLDWLRRYPSIISLDATPTQFDETGGYYGHARMNLKMEAIKTVLYSRCFHLAHGLITWSQWTKDGLAQDYGISGDKVTVIPPGVIPSEWASPIPRSMSLDGSLKILFVGADFKRKGGLCLLQSFRELRNISENDRGRELELHIVTKAILPPEPGVFVHNDLQPNSDRLKSLYHQCDIFCLPTFGDCLPMVLSEAGAAGLPAVSTNLAAIPEIIADGETGLIVPVGDQIALTRALKRLVDDQELRLKLGAEAVQLVSEKFDAVHNANQLLNLIKETAHSTHNEKPTTKRAFPTYPGTF